MKRVAIAALVLVGLLAGGVAVASFSRRDTAAPTTHPERNMLGRLLGRDPGGKVDPDWQELAGLPRADVADVISRDDSHYESVKDHLTSVQTTVLGWSACRGIYAVYAGWVRTGKVGPKPTARVPKVQMPGVLKTTEVAIDALYEPITARDRATATAQLRDLCGIVPVAEAGDRSVIISERLGP